MKYKVTCNFGVCFICSFKDKCILLILHQTQIESLVKTIFERKKRPNIFDLLLIIIDCISSPHNTLRNYGYNTSCHLTKALILFLRPMSAFYRSSLNM